MPSIDNKIMPERHKTNENYNLTFQNELKEIQ